MFSRLFEHFIFGPYLLVFVLGSLLFSISKMKYKGWTLRICAGILFFHILAVNSITVALVSLPLRSWVPESSDKSGDAIVVHGSSALRIGAPTSGSSERGYLGAEAFLDGRAPLLLVMGYSPTDSLGSAKAMRIIARGMGVPDAKILMTGGRTTYEEAQLGAQMLRNRGHDTIILVSSWYHVPRAVAVWQKLGFEVVAYTYIPDLDIGKNFMNWSNIWRLQLICHEYGGIFVYWLRGWL